MSYELLSRTTRTERGKVVRTPEEIEAFWSDYAPRFDEEPDHGLLDPAVRAAWAERLASWMPAPPAVVADLGCGTGSLSLLAAELGATVQGIDLSPAMVDIARQKAERAGVAIDFRVGDASEPRIEPASVDVVLCRHLIWTLPDPVAALQRWARALNDGGRMILIEGVWSKQPTAVAEAETEPYPWRAGVAAADLAAELSELFHEVAHISLTGSPDLWGSPVESERYALVAENLICA